MSSEQPSLFDQLTPSDSLRVYFVKSVFRV